MEDDFPVAKSILNEVPVLTDEPGNLTVEWISGVILATIGLNNKPDIEKKLDAPEHQPNEEVLTSREKVMAFRQR